MLLATFVATAMYDICNTGNNFATLSDLVEKFHI